MYLMKIILIGLIQTAFVLSYGNLQVFVNRFNSKPTVRIIITLQTLDTFWFTTRITLNEVRLIDYFQTNVSESRERLLWLYTGNLMKTLNYYEIFAEKPLPYLKCFYHLLSVQFCRSGYHNVTASIRKDGLTGPIIKASKFTYIDLQENIRCEPEFHMPQCYDSNYPLHYETTEVILLRAEFTRRCPMDSYSEYYWTLHDSTGKQFLGGTVKPEIKIGRYRIKVRQQSPLNRMVMLRLNARIVGRRMPLVARCYIALASQRLYAAIRGGQYRKVFRGKTNYISASPSRDLSVPVTADQHLLYEWSCKSFMGKGNKFCRPDMGRSKRIVIPAYSQSNEQTVKITLTIRSTYDYLRTAVAMQTISFTSSAREYIDVNIKCVSNCAGNKFTSMQPIHLKGVCPKYPTKMVKQWTWTVLNKVVGTSQRLIYKADKKRTALEITLNIEAEHKSKKNAVYYGRSNCNMQNNKGPADSSCAPKPLEGLAMETLFHIRCQQSESKLKPLLYCVGIDGFLIMECTTDEHLIIRLPPTSYVNVKVCDNLGACETVLVEVDVHPTEIESSEISIINYLTRVRLWLGYADWQRSFILLYQLTGQINTKERLLVFTRTLDVYRPQTTVQLAQLVRLTRLVVNALEPLNDMEVNLLARMFHIIAFTFKSIIKNNELNTLMDEYYETMVNDLCELLDRFSAEWEFIPKAQCHAGSESCLNINSYRFRLEQMATLQPQTLVHVNNWMHAHWKLSTCLFYMGMGTATRLRPQEGPKVIERNTFTMLMESFDLDLDRAIILESGDSMHTLLFTDQILKEMSKQLENAEVLISIRSHKQTQYWWYPEQESRTQVLVVNAYTSNAIWDKKQFVSEPFQFISRLKINFSAFDQKPRLRKHRDTNPHRRQQRRIDFDDPQEDVKNIVNDNVLNAAEVRMYRTEIYGHSVLAIIFTKADIDFRVLMQMTRVPKLAELDNSNSTCVIKSNIVEPKVLLLRNRCEMVRPIYIYMRANNPSEPWNEFRENGAYFTFHTEVRSCRIWNYARPEPRWRSVSCFPEMNKTVKYGIHCYCNFISDFDADVQPIISVCMNLKCHLERPTVGRNYQILVSYILLPIVAILYLLIGLFRSINWDKQLYVEDLSSGKVSHRGDVAAKLTFGGSYNSGTSANIVLSLRSSHGLTNVIIYQDPLDRTFQRNCTISFRLQGDFVKLPVQLALGHDNSGIYPHYFCRNVILTDTQTKKRQIFHVQRRIRATPLENKYLSSELLTKKTQISMTFLKWSSRFYYCLECFMGNWYLFQPLVGPWRLGITNQFCCRWERSCIFIAKLCVSVSIVIIYFGRTLPIACDPNPKRFDEFNVVIWLCLACYGASSIVSIILDVILRMLLSYN